MEFSVWALPMVNAIAAALLINSGVSKFVAPGPPRRALAEIAPIGGTVAEVSLRGLAVAEITVAAALLLAPVRIPAAIAVLVLGTGFTLLGVLGISRHSKAPCGCFGASSQRPFGWLNILLGAALVAVFPVNVRAADTDYTAAALIGAAIGTIVLCIYFRRELVVQFLWPRNRVSAESGAR